METDESAMRESFALSLEDMRARIDKLIARHNTTELEELETRMREVLMKVSELGWRLGARGANLRAVVEEVSEEQERLFGLEAARLQQIKEEEVHKDMCGCGCVGVGVDVDVDVGVFVGVGVGVCIYIHIHI